MEGYDHLNPTNELKIKFFKEPARDSQKLKVPPRQLSLMRCLQVKMTGPMEAVYEDLIKSTFF